MPPMPHNAPTSMPPSLVAALQRLKCRLAAACAALLLAATPAWAQGDPTLPGEVLVKLRSDSALPGLMSKYGLSLVSRFGSRPIYRFKVAGATAVDTTVAALLLEPQVLLAEANSANASPEGRKNLVWAAGKQVDYTAQWAPQALRLAEAQRVSQGAGVTVAVLDTGIDRNHPLLAGRVLPGFDFVDFDTDPAEQGTAADTGWGHGTHVAGLVLLAAPQARILPVRVLDAQGRGNAWVLAEALLYALDPDGNPATRDGAQVINVSLGSLNRTELLGSLSALASCSFITAPDPADDFTDPGYNVDRERCAAGAGAVVVAAAGNDGSRSLRQYPAAERAYGLLPVGATRSATSLAAFSNSGSWVSAASPGEGITSSLPGDAWGTWSGTSMATPLAAGVAALVRAREPALSATDLVRRLVRSGRELCDAKPMHIDAAAALGLARSPKPRCR